MIRGSPRTPDSLLKLPGTCAWMSKVMAEEDIAKTAFRCPGAIGLFEWVVMTFGLKNAGELIKGR